MDKVLKFLEDESYNSVSGVTVECARWPGYDTAYRVMSKRCTGPWMPSVPDAIDGYLNQKEIDNSVK